uniref:Uncharacterized protein n=1 Tax=Theileria annulata TaxID=5874 RepID=A0A3B0MM74_THEAN
MKPSSSKSASSGFKDGPDDISEEDLKLIRHLTWLYGGYQMRSRNTRNPYVENKISQNHHTNTTTKNSSSVLNSSKSSVVRSKNLNRRNRTSNSSNTRDNNNSIVTSVEEGIGDRMRMLRSSLNRRLRHDYEIDVNDHRKPSWPDNFALSDKVDYFISNKIADTTEFRNKEPNTLSICGQFALQNHEAMVADTDRVHYYRAAIFWTGHSSVSDNTMDNTVKNITSKHLISTVDLVNTEGSTTTSTTSDDNSQIDDNETVFVDTTYESLDLNSFTTTTNTSDITNTVENTGKSVESDVSNLNLIHTNNNNGKEYYCSGKRILEIGTGPMCVLAMNALKAGARYVDALEVSVHASRLAGKLMAAYGFDNVIRVFNTHSKLFVFDQNEYFGEDCRFGEDLLLPSTPPYDMIISEILGDFASQEGVADVFLDLQRRILFENKRFINSVKSIPSRVSTLFVPSFFPDSSNIINKSSSDSEMTIFSPSKKMLQSVGMRIDNLPACEEWLPLEHLNLEEWMLPQMCQHYLNLFTVSTYGNLAGLLVGIDVEIRPGEHFGTRYGQCESWYTNFLLLDKEYTVFKGDLVLVNSIANLTNYTKANCDNGKIQVSRPSYSFKIYILSPINILCSSTNTLDNSTYISSFDLHEESIYNLDTHFAHSVDTNNSVESVVTGLSFENTCENNTFNSNNNTMSVKLICNELKRISYEINDCSTVCSKKLNENQEFSTTACTLPEDILKDHEFVRVRGEVYRVMDTPPTIHINYLEQTSTIYYDTPCSKRKMHTDPPKRYQKIKLKPKI